MRLDIDLRTHPVNEALADQYGDGMLQRAYTRVRLTGETIILDELELERIPTSIASWLDDHDTRGGSDSSIARAVHADRGVDSPRRRWRSARRPSEAT